MQVSQNSIGGALEGEDELFREGALCIIFPQKISPLTLFAIRSMSKMSVNFCMLNGLFKNKQKNREPVTARFYVLDNSSLAKHRIATAARVCAP